MWEAELPDVSSSISRINDLVPLWFLTQIHTHSFNKHLLRVYEPDTALGLGDTAVGDRSILPLWSLFPGGDCAGPAPKLCFSAVVPLITDDRKRGTQHI